MVRRDEISMEDDNLDGLLRDAIDSLSEGFALYDENYRLVIFNERYRDMNSLVSDILEPGMSFEIMLREMARRGAYSDAVGRENEWVAERLENFRDFTQEEIISHTNGRTYLVSINPTKHGGFVVTRTDITERKQAEAMERDGDILVRQVVDINPAAVVMAHIGSGEIIYRSPAALKLYGKVKYASEFFVTPADRADYITQLLADGYVDEYKLNLTNSEGEEFPALLFGRVAEYKGEDVAVTTAIDLTKQVEAESLIRKVLQACPVPIQMTNAETGTLLFSSPGTTALFGKVESAKSYYVNSKDREPYVSELKNNRSVNNMKMRLHRGDGKQFWGAVSANMIDFNNEEVIVSNTRDLSDELALQEELETQREMLFQNEKMSALGELLAGVAHELNNPLTVVVGHSMMLREEAKDPETLRRIEKISNAAERCAKIVKTFLAMARQQPTKMEQVDISSIITTAVDVAGYGIAQGTVDISSAIRDDLPQIVADADQITQVIINLLTNAEHAINDSGTGDKISVTANHLRGSENIEICVEDNGPGIPKNIRARVFEPFFTTKDIGEGTGIGLAFCHRIIHSHHGHIRLDHDFSNGSRFCITLPIALGADQPLQQGDVPVLPGNEKKLLVVDDEVEVAELIAEILTRDGFQVDIAQSGSRALERMGEKNYDVVLSDLNMPGLGGRGLYEEMLKHFPSMVQRTGFFTGDTMGATSQKLLLESKRPYMEKPVSPDGLRKLIYGILDDMKE